MALFAVLIYTGDSAHEPGESAETSEDIATCDDHAEEMASSAAMTAAWAFTPRSMARSGTGSGVTQGPFIDGADVVAGVYFLEAPDLESAVASAATNPVVTLCGSMRFREELERLEAELTLAGHVVLAPTGLDPSAELDAEERARLGRIHLQKIAMSDEVLIVNVGGYVGESTRREIEHARSRGLPVRFLEPPAEEQRQATSPV